jgi:RND family efflux transporter MFP subunit
LIKAISHRLSAIGLLASLAGFSGCGGGGSESHPKAESLAPAVAVQTVTAATRQWPEVYEATGTVRARTAAVLSSKVMAYVREVGVQVGDRVSAGQLLVTLDAQDLDASVRRAEAAEAEVQTAIPEAENGIAAAKAGLELAQVTFQRMQELAAKKSISNQEFDEASARLKAAQATYDMARAKRQQLDPRLAQTREATRAAVIMRDYARISAPFAGVVTAKSVEPGNLASPGAPLLAIEREDAYRLEALVEESKLPLVKRGQSVEVSLEALNRRMVGRVAEIVPVVDAVSRANTVKIDLPAIPELRSGMFGRALFPMAARKVLAIPPAALVERGQLESVFVVEEGAARSRLVTTGKRAPDAIEVLSGLSEGEALVSPAPAGLADGARVEVRQ